MSIEDARRGIADGRRVPRPARSPQVPVPTDFESLPPARHSLDELRESLRASLAAALYMKPEDVAADVPFTELGLDSIISVEWIQAVNKQYGLKIPATRVYDCPTVVQFAAYLEKELASKPRNRNCRPPHPRPHRHAKLPRASPS
jgi:acyl carrier protein